MARGIRVIYEPPALNRVERAFEASSLTWDAKDPTINAAWQRNWSRLPVFFDFPPEIRKVIYTTNAIESLNFSLRKVLKSLGAFPIDDSALNDSTAASVRRSSK